MRVLVIGAGLSGATVARLHADRGDEVLVCEQAERVGGMCADERYQTWYEPLHGPHFFHTNDAEVWSFLSRFTAWHPYEHRVLAAVNGKLVPIPVNIETVNALLDAGVEDEIDMRNFMTLQTGPWSSKDPENSEDVALQRVGSKLYELLFEPYTLKQWGRHPRELPPEILARIPVRMDHEDRYFTDTYQGIPKHGYQDMILAMLDHSSIDLMLDLKEYYTLPNGAGAYGALRGVEGLQRMAYYDRTYYTGRIDGYWGESELEYRSADWVEDPDELQPVAVVNHPMIAQLCTRTTQMGLAYGEQHPLIRTLTEYPFEWKGYGTPYYPVPTADNLAKYAEYQRRALELEAKGIYMVGRLATYKYLNMDQAVRAAIDLVRRLP